MEHYILRCKHCNKEYTYCTYGNGPEFGTEEGCSKTYCADCQKAIDDALSKIPIRYTSKMIPVSQSDFDTINEAIAKERERYLIDLQDGVVFNAIRIIPQLGYKNVCGCFLDRVYYLKGEKKNGDIEILYSAEYDLINNQLTGKKYRHPDNPSYQYMELCQCPPLGGGPNKEEIKPTGLSAPEGKLYYFDFEKDE